MPQTQNSYDSGASFNSVSIPNVNGVYAYAHAYSNSAGGPNNDHRQAYIFQIQAWGIVNPYVDAGISIEKNGIQRIGAQPLAGTNITNTNNLRFYNGQIYQVPFLNTQTVTLLPNFNSTGYQWGNVVALSSVSAGTMQLFTNTGSLMAVDDGNGHWISQSGYSVSGGINGYSSGCNGGYVTGLITVNVSPAQGAAPYVIYRDPQAGNLKVRSANNNYYLPNYSTNLTQNLCLLPGTSLSYSGGNGPGQCFNGDFYNNPYGTTAPNEIDVYAFAYFPQQYTLTNINFRFEMLYYAYGDHQDTGNFNAEIYYTTNGGSSWTNWWSTSG